MRNAGGKSSVVTKHWAQCHTTFITFLNKAIVTLYCRGSKKILALDTWKSLEFNLDVGSITLCLVPQLFMLELMAA
jgi:hypothetical protein